MQGRNGTGPMMGQAQAGKRYGAGRGPLCGAGYGRGGGASRRHRMMRQNLEMCPTPEMRKERLEQHKVLLQQRLDAVTAELESM